MLHRFKTPEGRYELVHERTQGLVPFHYQRSTRLTLANLQAGGAEDGSYVVFNVGEVVHIARRNATHKEPLRSLPLCNTATRALPSCHDYQPAKDGVDLLVGIADGAVHLLSLKAQLTNPPSSKPIIAATLTPEASAEQAKCVAVLWLPRSDGLFVAGFSSGSIYVYKKSSILGEGAGRFSLSLGSNSKSNAPHSTFTITGRGIHDLAASPDGTRLAAACCDGTLRLVDVATGTVVGGFQSYYGAMLCCSFSPDGRYVAAAGEDDLVSVYGLSERWPIVHCQGHDSWVTRLAWDPWMQLQGAGGSGGPGSSSSQHQPAQQPDTGKVYRLASVGQDTCLCLWDIQIAPGDGDLYALPIGNALTMRKSASNVSLGSPARGPDGTPPQSHHQRKPSVSSKANGGGITPSLARAEMNIILPTMQHRIHNEPLSDILFTDEYVLTGDHSGCIRTWQRPAPYQRISTQRAALMSKATGDLSTAG